MAKNRKNALDRAEVEQLSLQRRQPGHTYWVGTREAAELLGVSPSSVTHYARVGRLPAVRYDGRNYYRRHQVEVIANAREARLLA